MINFFRKDEKHCFTRRVVKNYFAHLSILKRYFSKLSHFYSDRTPSVMHNSNRLNCTLFYFHPRMHLYIYVTCLSESRFSSRDRIMWLAVQLTPVLALQSFSLNQTSCVSRRESKTICLTNLEFLAFCKDVQGGKLQTIFFPF